MAERRQAIIGVTEDPLGNIWILSATEGLNNNCIDVFNSNMSYLGSHINDTLPDSFLEGGIAVFRQNNDDQAVFYFITIFASDISSVADGRR